jgi:uncharacterized protein
MEMRYAVEVTSALQDYRYLNLTTFRKNDTLVVTTVWFAQMDESVYVWTAKMSGQVKRIRNSSTVRMVPSTHLGQPCGSASRAAHASCPLVSSRRPSS